MICVVPAMAPWGGRLIVVLAVALAAGSAAAARTPAQQAERLPARYSYHGCPVYTSNDWFTTNLYAGSSTHVPTSVDPHSADIIRNLQNAFGEIDFSGDVSTTFEGVNLVNVKNRLATPIIEDVTYGFANNVYNDDPPPYRIEINRGTFMQEGTAYCAQSGQDCHVNVLDTDKCVMFETYRSGGVSWNGSRYTAEGGGVENLRHPYQIEHIVVSAAHLPMMGTTDWGEDVQYQKSSCQPDCAIPHIVAFFLPQPGVATRGYVLPAAGEAFPCSSGRYCNAFTLPYGARLRLKASYVCPKPASYPQANLLCNQAKQYGWIFNDTSGMNRKGGIRMGLSANATDPWHHDDFTQFLTHVHLTDFDVMTLGRVH